jgi:hypothetical protein
MAARWTDRLFLSSGAIVAACNLFAYIYIYIFSFWRGGGAELMSRHLSEMCRRRRRHRFRRRMQHPYNIMCLFGEQ